jgi:hypothetical protein
LGRAVVRPRPFVPLALPDGRGKAWPMSRALIALVLSLVLSVASVALAVSRGQAAGLSDLVICSNGSVVTLTLDAQGNRVERPHHCPDCLVVSADAPVPVSAPLFQAAESLLMFSVSPPDVAGRSVPRAAARGPPACV